MLSFEMHKIASYLSSCRVSQNTVFLSLVLLFLLLLLPASVSVCYWGKSRCKKFVSRRSFSQLFIQFRVSVWHPHTLSNAPQHCHLILSFIVYFRECSPCPRTLLFNKQKWKTLSPFLHPSYIHTYTHTSIHKYIHMHNNYSLSADLARHLCIYIF